MEGLTERQIQILKSLIEEYIETALPVASETLDKKYNLGVSPATIRNEMVVLTKKGFLKQPHTSAGRTPTPLALRLYVDKLMKTEDISVSDEVNVKQKIWDYRNQMDKMLREATRALAEKTKTMSLAATDTGDFYTSGLGNILDMPEFYDIDMTKHLLETLDEFDYWWEIFSRCLENPENLNVLLGEDLEREFLNQCGGVFATFRSPTHQGVIGVVGPSRLNYPRIIPFVRYIGGLLTEFARNW